MEYKELEKKLSRLRSENRRLRSALTEERRQCMVYARSGGVLVSNRVECRQRILDDVDRLAAICKKRITRAFK